MNFCWNSDMGSDELLEMKDNLDGLTIDDTDAEFKYKIPKLVRRLYTKKHLGISTIVISSFLQSPATCLRFPPLISLLYAISKCNEDTRNPRD
jgi:hypothetical protein